MADLHVAKFDMVNPFVIASSPATCGADNVVKSSRCRPGAIVMRNFGHGKGGGGFIYPSAKAMYAGEPAFHSHAVGRQMPDPVDNLDKYCEEVRKARKLMHPETRLWVSIGHYSDLLKKADWEKDWKKQAHELVAAGADALELHFNTPGVAVAGDRRFNYYQLVYNCTQMVKREVPETPVMVKLAVENCDPLTSMRQAMYAGADAVGPTARWKAFYFDLDWKATQARPGAGYGGTQATPLVCYAVAEARKKGVSIPIYAGGGVFSHEPALKLVMAGADMVQLGALACSGGTMACANLIRRFNDWMDQNGYPDLASLKGDALKLFDMDPEFAKMRQNRLADAYQHTDADPSKCIGCGRCQDVCWYKGIELVDRKARKTKDCIGCGYCFQVCPVGALQVDAPAILKSAWEEK
ncbi:MAG: 4Fe-4S binding protein [Spirochaetaceae bacterium]|nr:4Fe-4S binding protein [Spirochaetaceae bacterium]